MSQQNADMSGIQAPNVIPRKFTARMQLNMARGNKQTQARDALLDNRLSLPEENGLGALALDRSAARHVQNN